MDRTYKATGINLRSMPLSENDRLLTILTGEFGLIRAVAPGARKHHSKLGGRSELFVVNELLIAKGRELDKITQAETKQSYPGLGKDLAKLAASQYLAEVVLGQALSEQPQQELYAVLNEHLRRLEQLPTATKVGQNSGRQLILAYLCHGIFHLLALAGIAPQVHVCCVTKHPLTPNFSDLNWRVGLSFDAGSTVSLSDMASPSSTKPTQTPPTVNVKLNAVELALLQQLAGAELSQLDTVFTNGQGDVSQYQPVDKAWLSVERILRQYTQYHNGRSIRSAALMDACFA